MFRELGYCQVAEKVCAASMVYYHGRGVLALDLSENAHGRFKANFRGVSVGLLKVYDKVLVT